MSEIRMPTRFVNGVECYSREQVREEMRDTCSTEFDEPWPVLLLHFDGRDRLWFEARTVERIFDGWGWK